MTGDHNDDYDNGDDILQELADNEVPFWIGDFISVKHCSLITTVYRGEPPKHYPKIFQIVGIDYNILSIPNGNKYSAYKISDKLGAGWHTSVSEDNITLVERGPLWKFYHNQPLTFDNIRDEAQFFDFIGHFKEVRNPVNGLFMWTKKEVLDAIRKGTVHYFTVDKDSIGIFFRAKRFKNKELGQRVAKATLKGFKLSPD